MITKREIPVAKKYVTEEHDETGKLISRTISVEILTLNEETENTTKWIVRHFESEYVYVYADTAKNAAMIAAKVMIWDIVKVVKNLKTNRGEFYDEDGNRLEYDFRRKEFYLAE